MILLRVQLTAVRLVRATISSCHPVPYNPGPDAPEHTPCFHAYLILVEGFVFLQSTGGFALGNQLHTQLIRSH